METRKIIVNSNCYHGYSLKEAAEGIAQAGFHHIELTATKGWTEHVFPTMSFQDLLEKRELLRDYGLAVPAMSGHCNLMDPERIPDFLAVVFRSLCPGAQSCFFAGIAVRALHFPAWGLCGVSCVHTCSCRRA